MAYINIAEWSPEHVGDWLRGLDNMIIPYVHFFLNDRVDGHRLLTLGPDDLTMLNITKIGHQELILEAVDHLRQLHYYLINENLQSLALKVGCLARSLHNGVQCHLSTHQNADNKKVNTEILAAASELIVAVKQFVSWIDRPPFKGQDKYFKIRKTVLQLSLELASTAQRDHFADNPLAVIKQKCLYLAELSDFIVQEYTDSLIIQPASLDVVTAKKSAKEDDWGMQINSTYSGIHIVGNVKYQSPVQLCTKVEEGDEIIQVNYQTVLGWSLDHLKFVLQDRKTEVTLTLKKRPRHSNLLGQIIALKPYKIPVNKIGYEKQQLNIPEEGFPNNLEPEPSSPRVLREVEADDDAFLPSNEDKQSESDQNVVSRLRSQVRNRRTTIQRRATVSGASPTVTKAPVSFEDLLDSSSMDGTGVCEAGSDFGKKSARDHVTRSVSHDPSHGQNQPHAVADMVSRRLLTPPLKHTKVEPRQKMPAPTQLPSPLNKIFATRAMASEKLIPADRNGWLFIRPKNSTTKWLKRWAVLKNSYLYLYKSRHECKAVALIFLPGFIVGPAHECRTKKFPFKLEHSSVSFIFACEDQSDNFGWQQKLRESAATSCPSKPHYDGKSTDIERNSVMVDQTVYYSESDLSNPESGEEEQVEPPSPIRTTAPVPVSTVPTTTVTIPPPPQPAPPATTTASGNPKPKPRTIFLSSTLPRKPSVMSLPGTPLKPTRQRGTLEQMACQRSFDGADTSNYDQSRSSPIYERVRPLIKQDQPKQARVTPIYTDPTTLHSRSPDLTEGMFKKAQQQQAERNKMKLSKPQQQQQQITEDTSLLMMNCSAPSIPPRCATSQQIKDLYLQRNWVAGRTSGSDEDFYGNTNTRIDKIPPPLPPNKPDILAGTHEHDRRI